MNYNMIKKTFISSAVVKMEPTGEKIYQSHTTMRVLPKSNHCTDLLLVITFPINVRLSTKYLFFIKFIFLFVM